MRLMNLYLKDNIAFPDEVLFGSGLVKVFNSVKPDPEFDSITIPNRKEIRELIDSSDDGYMSPSKVKELLKLAGIKFVDQNEISSIQEAKEQAKKLVYPVVMKWLVHCTNRMLVE